MVLVASAIIHQGPTWIRSVSQVAQIEDYVDTIVSHPQITVNFTGVQLCFPSDELDQ